MNGVRRFNVSVREKMVKDDRETQNREGGGGQASSGVGRELTRCPGLPTTSNGPTAVGAHVFVASPDPEQHHYVQ